MKANKPVVSLRTAEGLCATGQASAFQFLRVLAKLYLESQETVSRLVVGTIGLVI